MSVPSPRRPALFPLLTAVCAAIASLALPTAQASSHREAPSIAGTPRVDGTDFYMFNSYEGVAPDGTGGRSGFVTLIANYQPLQDPYGGPNYFKMDPNALYEIHVDSNGDAKEDLTFQFKFVNQFKAKTLNIGNQVVPIPLTQFGSVSNRNDANLNVNEKFSLTLIRGDRRSGTVSPVTNPATGTTMFDKPSDYIGTKTLPGYAAYAADHVYSVNLPGCATPAKVFVGQRQEGFAVNLGTIFDLVNAQAGVITSRANINAAVANSIQDKNVTTLALEVHKSCLTQGSEPVIGGWTTASVRQSQLVNANPPAGYQTSTSYGGAFVQVSRLGNPLVNEVVIGLPDKDRFNAAPPTKDGMFATYVTHPTLPALISAVLNPPSGNVLPPTNLPRLDLVTTFLTGIPGVNQPANVVGSEMLRLNTAIPPLPFNLQNRLGIVGTLRDGGTQDFAGFPNGRRPKDDVVDIALVAMMGGLCWLNNGGALFGPACNRGAVPLGATSLELHDAVDQAEVPFLPGFPYLATPNPGAQ